MRLLSALARLLRDTMARLGELLLGPALRGLGWLWGRLPPLRQLCYAAWAALPGALRALPLPWRSRGGPEPGGSEEDGRGTGGTGGPAGSGNLGGPGHRVEDRPERDEFTGEDYRVEATDEFYCSYDSTWETEESPGPPGAPGARSRSSPGYGNSKFSRFVSAARDMQNYRHGYPNQFRMQHRRHEAQNDKPNLSFYLGHTSSSPDGVFISEFHDEWYGNYDQLEYVHTYIQWLFPLQEPGMNRDASTLTQEEIQDFLDSSVAKENLLKSYKLMLDFYGMQLADEATGEVMRADHWMERFNNLNSRTHNNLRITRILKCLGTLGFQHYQAPLVHFFLEQTQVQGELPNVKDSVLNYFLFGVLDKSERRKLLKFAYLNSRATEEFVWCPRKIQTLWSRPGGSRLRRKRKRVGASGPSAELYSSDESQDEDTAEPSATF
ncbi:opioid growth factor receptor-like isoform X2 [Cololabis saira]|uniref:opioid growth factor receptor-like isoform X2 n=1 Tax=Cololabis saira TaxID=129043 RepID=UPI002AD42984|nr:opioid growth factor receptor-like isoform X2 [Cololabis saira]